MFERFTPPLIATWSQNMARFLFTSPQSTMICMLEFSSKSISSITILLTAVYRGQTAATSQILSHVSGKYRQQQPEPANTSWLGEATLGWKGPPYGIERPYRGVKGPHRSARVPRRQRNPWRWRGSQRQRGPERWTLSKVEVKKFFRSLRCSPTFKIMVPLLMVIH